MPKDLDEGCPGPGAGASADDGGPRRLPVGGGARAAALFGGSGAVILLALLGWATGDLWVYPPIGATAFLIFSMPELPSAAPRNAVGDRSAGWSGVRWPWAPSGCCTVAGRSPPR